VGFLFLVLPLQDRMRTWRLKRKHPAPIYLSTAGALYGQDARVYAGELEDGKTFNFSVAPAQGFGSDPSAQVDEIKAQLTEEARRVNP
jgi:hypothetical protein